MKQAAAISLIIILSWQLIFQASYLIYWKSNQSYITAKFCENKTRPQMHCNGKCHLMKTLDKWDQDAADHSRIPIALLKIKLPDALLVDWNLACQERMLHNGKKIFDYKFQFFSKGFFRTQENPPDFV